MAYLHVLVALSSEPSSFTCIFPDLDAAGVRNRFVQPFRAKHDLVVNGRIYRPSDIAAVSIRRTERPAAEELERIKREMEEATDRLNDQGGGLVIMPTLGYSLGDLATVGDDVTSEFLPSMLAGSAGAGRLNRFLAREAAERGYFWLVVGFIISMVMAGIAL